MSRTWSALHLCPIKVLIWWTFRGGTEIHKCWLAIRIETKSIRKGERCCSWGHSYTWIHCRGSNVFCFWYWFLCRSHCIINRNLSYLWKFLRDSNIIGVRQGCRCRSYCGIRIKCWNFNWVSVWDIYVRHIRIRCWYNIFSWFLVARTWSRCNSSCLRGSLWDLIKGEKSASEIWWPIKEAERDLIRYIKVK